MQEKNEKIRLTVAHVRAARGLLGWTIADLAKKSGVSTVSLSKWENRRSEPTQTTRDKVQDAFDAAGVVFSNGDEPGVKRRKVPV
jgi:transcriptional regulator with XRE-family HTH domain